MANVMMLNMMLSKPIKREYKRDDYERMLTWVQKNVDFDKINELLKKLNETIRNLVLEVAHGNISVDEAIRIALSERGDVASRIEDEVWEEIIDNVYSVAKKKLGRDVAEKIKKGWENAKEYDSYQVFSDFFEEFKSRIPSRRVIIVKLLTSRKPDVVYKIDGKTVRRYKWLDIEINILKEMVSDGYSIREIHDVMPYRTLSSIRNKIYRLKKKGEL